jgi:hypothetical protein
MKNADRERVSIGACGRRFGPDFWRCASGEEAEQKLFMMDPSLMPTGPHVHRC